MVKLFNTLTRQIDEFIPLDDKNVKVKIYSCGPTVYDFQHIGHMRRYIGDDILIRVLKMRGFVVQHVMNITDVGHLTSDADTGEDKMEKGAKKFNQSVWEIAKFFEKQFRESCESLQVQLPKDLMHATDYIKEQISLIQLLESKGFVYITSDGVYYDTAKFPNYFALSRQDPDELLAGARVELIADKRNISDFALWKFSRPGEKRQMEWDSPWGRGFPGWHIECSAMAMNTLGETLDIHTGGIDHIAVHHTNEIAQSEGATGKQFVRYWVHHNFLTVENEKMSKSLGNFITVQDVIKKGYDPLSLRYLYLQTHYRQEMNFTWASLDAAQKSLDKLRGHIVQERGGIPNFFWVNRFMDAMSDDLNTAKALAIVWELAKEPLEPSEKTATLLEIDKILGLQLSHKKQLQIPSNILALVSQRDLFRKNGDFSAADELRKKIQDLGYVINDTKNGAEIVQVQKHE